ncbi:MAG TPA: DUF4446 family protein [Epulopiscium sp.]|nr:DUF4446 family protein [Candidatus Epulonipiscium sp.]
MQQIVERLEINMPYIILGLIGMSFLFFILIIILFVKNKELKKRYNEFMRGTETDIEGLLRESIEKSTSIQESHKYIKDSVARIQVQLDKCVQKVGVVRYSAVQGAGPDLSFAIALLDDADNGVVVNGIYTREGSYTYAKEVVAGKSSHLLSDEENEAIAKSKQI